jgi:hypothetical protein
MFKIGERVRLTQPAVGEESAVYVVQEWNGDRGFIRLKCDLPIPPVELVRSSDICYLELPSTEELLASMARTLADAAAIADDSNAYEIMREIAITPALARH